MTKFEELVDVITGNKNNGKNKAQSSDEEQYDNQEIEDAGSKSTKTPQISFGSDEQDMDLTDQL